MAPSSATDIGRTAADSVFMGDGLMPVLVTRDVAVAAQKTSVQNFALAVGYNIFAVPLAMLGFASPLMAAIAMSTSSIIVIANSLRLGFGFRAKRSPARTRIMLPVDIPHFERKAA